MDELRKCAIFGALLFILSGTIAQANDPCTNYKSIKDPYRSTKYQLPQGHAAICDDKLTTGWYRFTSVVGGMMPETKPSPNHCGTVAPIWISDTHPSNGQEKQVTACTNVRDMSGGCLLRSKISIKNCGVFYVYKLKRVYGCPRAYCAGDKKPCPKGQVGVVPNCKVSNIDHFPSGLVPTPTITYKENPVDPLTMLCKFHQFPSWKNATFRVEWFTDGYSVKNDTICGDKTDPDCLKRYSELPALHADKIRKYFHPGHNVFCKLRMRYNTNMDNKWTVLAKQSNQFFVGIKVVASHQGGRLKECDKDTRVTVTFTPTVPIVDVNKKHLSIKIIVPIHHQLQTTSAVDTCDLKLPHGMLPNETRSIKITPICDNLNQNGGSMNYHFVISDFWQVFWLMYKLPTVRVTIDNTQQKQCQATGDPHYTTFDGRYYDFMPIGDYVLYKNTFTDTEVHARSWVCVYWSTSVTCNCGIAIREGADIMIFSVCNGNLVQEPRLLSTDIRSEKGLAPGTHIIRTVQGSTVTHNVLLPSGNRVKVERYDWGLNLYVKAFSPKPNTVYGLCGNLNGRQDDEFHHGGDNQRYGDPVSFGNSWRVDPSKSNFNLRLPGPTLPQGAILLKFCECPKQKGQAWDCEWDANRFHDFQKQRGVDIAAQFKKNRLRRSVTGTHYTDDIMDYQEQSFFVDEQEAHFALSRIRARRSIVKQAMSTANATKYCNGIIEDSTAGKKCRDVPGFNITTAISECITDLKLTGDVKFAGAAFDSMKEACEEVALKNVSLYKADASGKLKPPAEIGDNLCPGDCSNHGNCTNRTCICEEGFTSDDCSMNLNAVPELLGIYDGGLCDIRNRPCKKTDIFGRDFINSENITCHIREFKVFSSNWVPRPVIIEKPGVMIDIFGVRCELPNPPTKLDGYNSEGTPAGGLWIRISNDGEHKSQRQMRFISYDSVCMACNKTGNCTFKGNSCLIRGHCFAANETNPRDWCQQCMPGNDEHSWTRRKVNHPPSFAKGQSPRYAIVGENLPLQLNATDPDNRPVTYSLLSTTASRGYTLSSTGLLLLNVTSKEDFTLQVTDECNATDTITITVRIVVNPCKNGGKWSPHPNFARGSGMYSCQCPTGFTGDKCETNIDDCVSVNCGNGTCIDGVNNYTCQCNVGFEGSVCDQKIHKCNNQSCFAGVQCTESASKISCGPCPVGMSGDGKTCTALTTTAQPTTITTTTAPTTTTETTTIPTTTARQTTTRKPTTIPTTTASTTTREPTTIATTTERETTTKKRTTSSTTEKETSTTLFPTEETTTPKETTVKTEEPVTSESTTVHTEETSTIEPTTEEMKVKAEISLTMEWKSVYEDKQNKEYRSLIIRIETEIWKSYRKENNRNLKDVKVLSLRRGSVVATFQLFFKTPPKDDPLLPLNKNVADGKMGDLKVNAGSLRVVSTEEEKPHKPTKDNTLVYIIVPVVIAVVIIIAIVVLVCRSQKCSNYRLRKGSVRDTQPHEKLEMHEGWVDEQKADREKSSMRLQDIASTSNINTSFQD